jgi:hypothetical protein
MRENMYELCSLGRCIWHFWNGRSNIGVMKGWIMKMWTLWVERVLDSGVVTDEEQS